jgi:hypothetical protein
MFGRFKIKMLLGTGKMEARREWDDEKKTIKIISPFSVSIS